MSTTYRVFAKPTGTTWSYFVDLDMDGVITKQMAGRDAASSEIVAVIAELVKTLPVSLYTIAGTDASAAQAFAAANSGAYETTGPLYDQAVAYLT